MASRKKVAKRAKKGARTVKDARPQHRPRMVRGGRGPAVAARLEPAQLALLRALQKVRAGGASKLISEGLALVLPRAVREVRSDDPEDFEFVVRRARKELESLLEDLAKKTSLDDASAQAARDELERMLKS